MLVLSRQRDESIIIGDNIVVTIVDIRGDKVRLGIEAPTEIPVHRQEVYEAIQRENRQAARLAPTDTRSLSRGPLSRRSRSGGPKSGPPKARQSEQNGPVTLRQSTQSGQTGQAGQLDQPDQQGDVDPIVQQGPAVQPHPEESAEPRVGSASKLEKHDSGQSSQNPALQEQVVQDQVVQDQVVPEKAAQVGRSSNGSFPAEAADADRGGRPETDS